MSDLVSLYYLIQKATIHAVVSEEEEWHLNVVVVGANRAERVGMVGAINKVLVQRMLLRGAMDIRRSVPHCPPKEL